MNYDEMKHKLVEHYKEEIEDTHEYVGLADTAEENGDYETAECLYKIAKQEYGHAHALRKHLTEEYGYDPHTDHETERKWLAIKHL